LENLIENRRLKLGFDGKKTYSLFISLWERDSSMSKQSTSLSLHDSSKSRR